MMPWIIRFALSSGHRYALSYHGRNVALVPFNEDGTVRRATVWKTKKEAEKYLEKQLAVAPDLEKIGPFEFVEMVEPD